MSILIVFSGLPGTGKTTIATSLCRLLPAVHVRIDSIEHALQSSRHPMADSPLGYVVAQAVAADNLRLGHIVVADCVNPVRASRKAWRSVAAETGAIPLDVRLICSDVREHQRRAESRQSDVVGLIKPSWDRILIHDDEPWDVPPDLTLDTATSSPEGLTAQIAAPDPKPAAGPIGIMQRLWHYPRGYQGNALDRSVMHRLALLQSMKRPAAALWRKPAYSQKRHASATPSYRCPACGSNPR